ncbi:site-specific DNA-methyltransferase [Ensifer adhaerens]|uniref:site-specific DNA-methyltransferase n=1 Tax=Ensifer adhaerens TaxID=106592 RepID=UPI001CBB3159|nr:site-specific DNA-methyltransferase [Ensifer adhaerens]MBZ7921736.1 site-specific DNA-methyltransferase [Ensifer adhaerens]UAX94143.1 site-specific DNA-methyltransferase [Ensifer adhaerens]UAY01777.1 site-specific DNA-methyltransferase [Ensifer adhaerens]UAY09161.1 site-specific DNA-methyltransferase [Ensifer adhaerens]
MSDSLTDLILNSTPEDGTSIGNGAILALLRERLPDLSDEEYVAARDALIDDGILGQGRGRGGSIYRADVMDLTLEIQDEAEPVQPRGKARARARRSGEAVQVLSYRHGETRVNNPEVGMVHAGTDPDGARTTWSYDPHLDPVLNFDSARAGIERLIDSALSNGDPERMRDALIELRRLQAPYLNWTGKAERTSFEVDTVSLHVHERVDPATILANATKRLKGKDASAQWRQPDLFAAPFENLPLRQALDFYAHEKGWSNRLVAGDSLLVMNSLLTKESMGGKVQMIYIDPPYGIKYGSNFQPFVSKRDVKDRSDEDLTQEPEMIKAFRDTWELGIHSYLTYLRDRLVLARELLSETGSVFVQISDENLHHVTEILEEIFGGDNLISVVTVQKTSGATSELISNTADYLVWFAKNKESVKYRQLYEFKALDGAGGGEYQYLQFPNGDSRRIAVEERSKYQSLREKGSVYASHPMTSQRPPGDFPVDFMGQTIRPRSGYWKTGEVGFPRLIKANRILPAGSILKYRRLFEDFPVMPRNNLWGDVSSGASASDPKVYAVQTTPRVIERCLLMTTDPGDLVLDPTCGSGTTAFVAEKWGRRWITCDTSRVAITLAKQRLMTASFDYYSLRYPHEGLKGGFDYETVPHITLKSIANNPDIDTIYAEDHSRIEAALASLNAALTATPPSPLRPEQGVRKGQQVRFRDGETLYEWEVPFDWPDYWPEAARAPFDAFHSNRQAMQRRIDQSIADHAEQETLYDQPRVDRNRVRITGPFSVEAVPAPTVLSLDDSLPPTEANDSIARTGETSRQSVWRDELLKTGVRGKGGAMLTFAEFETLPGLRHLHASGFLAETGERVVVSFGPEHAALEQRQVELALTEAENLRPAPKFILFCAFTFDPEAAKDIDEVNWPGVTLLKAQMNTDLLTEDLKKARSSNQSFWLMGQPDVELRTRKDGMWEVEVNGFDYFDPKAGDLVSGGKRQIAMWSLDIDYDQRSLMPHQVFFPMADDKGGWNRLKTTVRAELDEDLLEQFHGTVSLPFSAGDNKRIAVKIVDDRGIESLKIMPLEG